MKWRETGLVKFSVLSRFWARLNSFWNFLYEVIHRSIAPLVRMVHSGAYPGGLISPGDYLVLQAMNLVFKRLSSATIRIRVLISISIFSEQLNPPVVRPLLNCSDTIQLASYPNFINWWVNNINNKGFLLIFRNVLRVIKGDLWHCLLTERRCHLN